VARRRNEIGIRIALGAHRRQVIVMIMRDAGYLLIVGVVAGTGFSLVAGRTASSLLFGLKPYDPLTLGAATALLTAIAATASSVPARRASLGTLPQFLEDGDEDDDDDRDEYDPSYAPRPSRWRWIPAGVVTLVVLGAVAAPWLLSSGARRALQPVADERYLKSAVDSVPFADTAVVRLDSASEVAALAQLEQIAQKVL